MKYMMSVFALALSGAVASAGAFAAQADNSQLRETFQHAAAVTPPIGIAVPDTQHDVIEPPSSIDPGMSLDPPQTGAKMLVIRPPATPPGSRLILPR
jgi:hypothetical protein